MFLALKEMRRAKARFGLLTVAIALLVFLILFQGSIQKGLVNSFIGAIRNQTAPVLVYSVDGQRFIQASTITAELDELARATDGVAAAGRLYQGTFTAVAGKEQLDTSLIGYERADLGGPSTLSAGRLAESAGEAVASDASADEGFGLDDVVTLQPGGLQLRIVGLASEAQLNAEPTLFVPVATYLQAVQTRNPDAGEPSPNVLGLRPADGLSAAELVERINARSTDLDALTRADAALATPGVSQVNSSFLVIFLLYGLVVPCVTGLFFLIITLQKAGSLTLLRAIGAPAGRLVKALMIQVGLIIAGGFALGLALYAPISTQRLGGIQLRFQTAAVLTWLAILVALGVLSAMLSARRVLRIEPIEATGAGG